MSRVERIAVRTDADIVAARERARALAREAGFEPTDLVLIATAISEMARNVVSYAGSGEVEARVVERGGRHGLVVTVRDEGPGIRDVELAMEDGYSTGRSLGLGLPGARRLMDDFEIASTPGEGTTVTMRKWVA